MAIIVEINKELAHCLRVDAVENLCNWISNKATKEIPLPVDEAIVEVFAGRTIRRYWSSDAVGVHLIWMSPVRVSPDHRVLVAIGADRDEDFASWQSRLTTVPHELSHISEFIRRFDGRTPSEVVASGGKDELQAWTSNGEPFHSKHEMLAREMVTAFLRDEPRWQEAPDCPRNCGCRPR